MMTHPYPAYAIPSGIASTTASATSPPNSRAIDPKFVAESAAAISDAVHFNHDAYNALYERVALEAGGFTGIWSFIADCAVDLEREHQTAEWCDGWIETCWDIAERILKMEPGDSSTAIVNAAVAAHAVKA